MALYIFFFPQLIAGPILRWNAIAPQLAGRTESAQRFAQGIRRFAEGLAKKMILANALAKTADAVFNLAAKGNDLGAAVAWLGAACYMLQIYFDFSGYSDMAIGLGKMFGFDFMENFNNPYAAQSIRDFWRRWHISLSSWFRDYLYIPLGGSRCSERRNQWNLLAVFFLCGLWHGASWTFVLWGLYHGGFIVLERTNTGRRLERLEPALRHFYTLLAVMVGWVLFRAPTIQGAAAYLANMVGMTRGRPIDTSWQSILTHQASAALLAGIICCTPAWPRIREWAAKKTEALPETWQGPAQTTGAWLQVGWITGLLVISATWLAGGTYNPFIYFRF